MFESKVNDTVVVAPCVQVVLYLDLSTEAGVLDFYQRSREALGGRLTHYQANAMRGLSKITPRAESMVPTWFTTPSKTRDQQYYMSMSEGDPDKMASPSKLYLNVYRRPPELLTEARAEWAKTYQKYGRQVVRVGSTLRLTLPLDHPLASPQKLSEWLLDLTLLQQDIPFSGHAGLALDYFYDTGRPDLYAPAEAAVASLLLRHPGLGWPGGAVGARILPYDPKTNRFTLLVERADWLNVLSDSVLSSLGGRAVVQQQISAEPLLSSVNLPHGLAIQAGDEPQPGDLGRRELLPAYRSVAKIVRPARIPEIGHLGANFMPNKANEWLNAFDKEYACA